MDNNCCKEFKRVEHVLRNSVVSVLHHTKEIQKELAKIDNVLNTHKCERPCPDVISDILTKDMPDFMKDLLK